MRLQIDIRITPDHDNMSEAYGNLQMQESVTFDGNSFLDIASVLGKFHDMLSELKNPSPGSE